MSCGPASGIPTRVLPTTTLGMFGDEGFRLFFPLSALYAALFPVLWVLAWGFDLPLATTVPPSIWHAHETLIGAFGAALIGFMTTAVPEWTDTEPPEVAHFGALPRCGRSGRSSVSSDGMVLGCSGPFLISRGSARCLFGSCDCRGSGTRIGSSHLRSGCCCLAFALPQRAVVSLWGTWHLQLKAFISQASPFSALPWRGSRCRLPTSCLIRPSAHHRFDRIRAGCTSRRGWS